MGYVVKYKITKVETVDINLSLAYLGPNVGIFGYAMKEQATAMKKLVMANHAAILKESPMAGTRQAAQGGFDIDKIKATNIDVSKNTSNGYGMYGDGQGNWTNGYNN